MTTPMDTTTRFTPASRLQGLSPYQPPAPDPRIDLSLDANEGPGPTPAVERALADFDPATLRRYPSVAELERRIADHYGIDPARVVVTNGADDAIDRVCRVALEPGRELLIHSPTFEMIERSGRLAGGSVRAVPWAAGPFPEDAFAAAITRPVSLVALVSPNNPTGGTVPADAMRSMAERAARIGALTLVDLAYVEFADADPTPSLLDAPNIVMTRTLSKALGLAGARVGYAIAPNDIAPMLRTAGGPYPISSVSAALADAALGEPRTGYIEAVRDQRQRFFDLLVTLGAEPLSSQANFLCVRFSDAGAVRDFLAERRIGVRAFTGKPGLNNTLRITLPGTESEFGRLQDALRAALACGKNNQTASETTP